MEKRCLPFIKWFTIFSQDRCTYLLICKNHKYKRQWLTIWLIIITDSNNFFHQKSLKNMFFELQSSIINLKLGQIVSFDNIKSTFCQYVVYFSSLYPEYLVISMYNIQSIQHNKIYMYWFGCDVVSKFFLISCV